MTENISLPEAERAELDRLSRRLRLLETATEFGVFATAAASLAAFVAPGVFPVIGALSLAGIAIGRGLLKKNRGRLNQRLEALEAKGNIPAKELEGVRSTLTRLTTSRPAE